MMQHDSGLAASPTMRNNLESGEEKYSLLTAFGVRGQSVRKHIRQKKNLGGVRRQFSVR
jgi:hypothetical protein